MEKVFLVTSFSSVDFESNVKTDVYANYDAAKERFESLAANIKLQLKNNFDEVSVNDYDESADAVFIKRENYAEGYKTGRAAEFGLWVELVEVEVE